MHIPLHTIACHNCFIIFANIKFDNILWFNFSSADYLRQKVDVKEIIIAIECIIPDNVQFRAYVEVKIKAKGKKTLVIYVEAYTGFAGVFTISNVDNLGKLYPSSSSSSEKCCGSHCTCLWKNHIHKDTFCRQEIFYNKEQLSRRLI